MGRDEEDAGRILAECFEVQTGLAAVYLADGRGSATFFTGLLADDIYCFPSSVGAIFLSAFFPVEYGENKIAALPLRAEVVCLFVWYLVIISPDACCAMAPLRLKPLRKISSMWNNLVDAQVHRH